MDIFDKLASLTREKVRLMDLRFELRPQSEALADAITPKLVELETEIFQCFDQAGKAILQAGRERRHWRLTYLYKKVA